MNKAYTIYLKKASKYFLSNLKIYLSVVENLERVRSNVIHLKKGEWLKDGKLDSYSEEIDFSSFDDFADKIKTLSVENNDNNSELWKNPTIPDNNDAKSFSKFKNLEGLNFMYHGIKSVENSLFNSFKNLRSLIIQCRSLRQFPELIFDSLSKLRDLDLHLCYAKVNNNHFKGLHNVEILKIENIQLDGDLESLVKLKELHLNRVVINEFTLRGLDKIETLKLIDTHFLKKDSLLIFQQLFFQNLKKFKHLENLEFEERDECFSVFDERSECFLEDIEFKVMMQNIPSCVKKFVMSSWFFEHLTQETGSMDFINNLKHLVVKLIEEFEIKMVISYFEKAMFQNLEHLEMLYDDVCNSDQKMSNSFFISKVKSLKSISLNEDEFTIFPCENLYLTRANFYCVLPEDLNLRYLKKLFLQHPTSDDEIPRDQNFMYNSLNERSLEDLVNLEELVLCAVFNSIDPDVQYLFKNLNKLKMLVLEMNEITILKSSYFNYLVDLEVVSLESNGIKVIESGSFKNSPKLRQLKLANNHGLEAIRKDVFPTNTQLRIIF